MSVSYYNLSSLYWQAVRCVIAITALVLVFFILVPGQASAAVSCDDVLGQADPTDVRQWRAQFADIRYDETVSCDDGDITSADYTNPDPTNDWFDHGDVMWVAVSDVSTFGTNLRI